MKISRRTDIINSFAPIERYLEIGLMNADHNFNHVKARIKISVDPDPKCRAKFQMTSNDYFDYHANGKFSLVFIDGLHHASQVYMDIINSLKFLEDDGVIICHDMNPTTEEMQMVPRIQSEWTGDSWKAWVKLRTERGDLEMLVVDIDYGCGIIRKGKQEKLVINEDINYQTFASNRKHWLNLVSVEEFLNYIKL
jgi:hypothetical protein